MAEMYFFFVVFQVINLVCRKGLNSGEETQFELQTFFEQIINTYCFHLWLDAL